MRFYGIPIFVDLFLMAAFRQCVPVRIPLLLILALLNLLWYAVLLGRFLYRLRAESERKGMSLEFVLCHFFLFMSLFLYRITDQMIIHDSL